MRQVRIATGLLRNTVKESFLARVNQMNEVRPFARPKSLDKRVLGPSQTPALHRKRRGVSTRSPAFSIECRRLTMVLSPNPFRNPRETAAERRGADFGSTCKIPQCACSRGRLIIPALSKELLFEPDPEGTPRRSGAFRRFSGILPVQLRIEGRPPGRAGQGPSAAQGNPLSPNSVASLQSAPSPMTLEAGSGPQAA